MSRPQVTLMLDDVQTIAADDSLDAAADAILDEIQIDDTNGEDRALIQLEYQRAINTIKQQRLAKINLRLVGDHAQYLQAEGMERLAAKVVASMRRSYSWLVIPKATG